MNELDKTSILKKIFFVRNAFWEYSHSSREPSWQKEMESSHRFHKESYIHTGDSMYLVYCSQ